MGPAKEYFLEDAAKHLVHELLTLRELTPTGEEKWKEGRFVEPVQLQVVCRRLWDKVVAGEGRAIAVSDVYSSEQTSEVDAALAAYYDVEVENACTKAGVRERNIRDWVEQKLITATRVRSRELRDPAALGGMDEAVQRMVEGHVLRLDLSGEREWIELSHDRLIKPVLKRNDEWREKHLALFQKQAKLWAEAGKSKPDLLLSGETLQEAERWTDNHPDDLTSSDKEFLTACKNARRIAEKERKQDRNMKILIVSAALSVLAVLNYSYSYFLNARPLGSLTNLSTGKVHQLRGEVITIGRSTEDGFHNSVSLTPTVISRIHLLLARSDLGAYDVRTLLGTSVNGIFAEYGTKAYLEDKDVIVLADIAALQFHKIAYLPLQFWVPSIKDAPLHQALSLDHNSVSADLLS